MLGTVWRRHASHGPRTAGPRDGAGAQGWSRDTSGGAPDHEPVSAWRRGAWTHLSQRGILYASRLRGKEARKKAQVSGLLASGTADNYGCRVSNHLRNALDQVAREHHVRVHGGYADHTPHVDPLSADRTRDRYLAMLRAHKKMQEALDALLYVYMFGALQAGASHTDVGAACGISRQAARKRWQSLRSRYGK